MIRDYRRLAKKAFGFYREHGVVKFMALVHRKLRKSRSGFLKSDPMAFFSFTRLPERPAALTVAEVEKKSINWVIPPFGIGSGGHLNIFRFAANLEALGFRCRIVIVGEPRPYSAQFAKGLIDKHFFPLQGPVFIGIENAPPAQFTIATSWPTAYYVRNFKDTCQKCYFVQDFEPWFFAVGSESIFAEETYRFGFLGITAGDWLAKKLASEFGMKTQSIGFSYDKSLYRPGEKTKEEKKCVFFYARPPTARRAFELGLLVLDEVARRVKNIEIVLAGWDVSGYVLPFPHVNAGLLSLDRLAATYHQCDVALVISLSNVSLLPLELMACGTPVVSNSGPWVEWLLNENNSVLAKPTVDALADAICSVLTDSELADRLREGGYRCAQDTNWESEAKKMAAILSNGGTE